MSEEKPERLGAILKRIEIILLRIAEQIDIELSDAENEAAALRKKPRHPCACRAVETAENKA
jgi:hypothetical protein